MSHVANLTWELLAAATAKSNGNHGLAHIHHRKAMKLAWW